MTEEHPLPQTIESDAPPAAQAPPWMTEVKAQVLSFPLLQISLQVHGLFQALPEESQEILKTMDDEQFWEYWETHIGSVLPAIQTTVQEELTAKLQEIAATLPAPSRILTP